MLSHAVDRSDRDIKTVTVTALKFQPDVIVMAELEDDLRGRSLSEIPAMIEQATTDRIGDGNLVEQSAQHPAVVTINRARAGFSFVSHDPNPETAV